jgi:hypothetical protein
MRRRHVKWVLLMLSVTAAAALLPGAGQSRPPESDGSTYTWTGAATLTVDVKPWGGGYVRSDPYLIDCPMACIRAFEPNRDVKLTAYMTPGHTFKAWEGACAGQGNPCTIKVSGSMDVTAVLEGQFVPPTPPKPPAPPVAPVNPALEASVTGTCPDCSIALTGTGYHANSSISLDIEYSSPTGWTAGADDVTTSSSAGSWSFGFSENCIFDGPFVGPIEFDVTGTDAQGSSASDHVSAECPNTA